MKKTVNYLLLIPLVVIVLGLTACNNIEKSNMHNANLTETYWKLTTLQGKTVKMGTNQRKDIHFVLSQENQRVRGFSGCNRFSGGYQYDPKKLTFSQLVSTRMACRQNTISEGQIFQVFEQTKTYQINGDKLSLFDADKHLLAVFEAVYLQ